MTQHLLAFARKQDLSPRPLDLCALAQRSAEFLRRTLTENVSIDVITDPAGPVPVSVDESQFENALLNLSLNARDSMPNGGLMRFSVAAKTVDEREVAGAVPPGRYGAISIQDTGTGMSPQTMKQVFDPFFTTKPVGKGSGLGLSMVYGFMSQSGGHVQVISTEGEGTTFTLLFPLIEEAEAEAALEQSLAIAASPFIERRLLLVEDIEDVRSVITRQLEGMGLEVTAVTDGAAALEALSHGKPFDILLTDLGLPGTLGGDQLADIAVEKIPSLKVVTMSGYNKERNEDGHTPRKQDRPHLRKPFRLSQLKNTLNLLFQDQNAGA